MVKEKYNKDGLIMSCMMSEKELKMKHEHEQKYFALWFLLAIGFVILLISVSTMLINNSNRMVIHCKVDGINKVPEYSILSVKGLDYIPEGIDCTYEGPMPR